VKYIKESLEKKLREGVKFAKDHNIALSACFWGISNKEGWHLADDRNSCCLLAATILAHKDALGSEIYPDRAAEICLGTTHVVILGIMDGFDGAPSRIVGDVYQEAYELGDRFAKELNIERVD